MAFSVDPADRQPKGDHNRRLSLGLDPEQFAAAAGITVEELREYERTGPDHSFSPLVAGRVGDALDRLEAVLPNSEAAGIGQPDADITALADALAPPEDQDLEASIRETAYLLWESEGRPEGREQEYWHRAREIRSGELERSRPAPVEADPDTAERAFEASRKIGLQRPFKKDPEDTTSGGFNQKRGANPV